MDNWGEIIYVNEEEQKVGEREAEGQRVPFCASLGGGSDRARPGQGWLGMRGDWGLPWDLRVSDWLFLGITLNASGKWGAHDLGEAALRYQVSLLEVDPERQESAREKSRARAVFESKPTVCGCLLTLVSNLQNGGITGTCLTRGWRGLRPWC